MASPTDPIGDRVDEWKRLRQEVFLGTEPAAAMLGVSRRTLQRIEAGQSDPAATRPMFRALLAGMRRLRTLRDDTGVHYYRDRPVWEWWEKHGATRGGSYYYSTSQSIQAPTPAVTAAHLVLLGKTGQPDMFEGER
jgi:hypothetical protein